MCLTPVRIKTNAKYFSLGSFKKLSFEVPCGHCAECQQMKKNEWYLRNYYEAVSTWSQDGYILFDTLTYSDDYLPTFTKTVSNKYGNSIFSNMDLSDINPSSMFNGELSSTSTFGDLQRVSVEVSRKISSEMLSKDFSCFNYSDVQNFLKRLRINLTRDGYDVKNCLRYFLCSEYGHENDYVDSRGKHRVGTMRPHYHILFYVTDSSLDPITLSVYVSDAWYLGRTDGYVYRGRSYVLNNTFGPRYIKDPNRLSGVQYYVTKYVCKDYEFEEKIDQRICTCLKRYFLLTPDKPDYFKVRRDLHRFMDQFHRQSLGFGAQALLDSDVLDSILNEFVIRIPDKRFVKKSIPVPMYYVRKLFQRCVKDSGGTLHWIWTDAGRDWKKSRIISTVDVLATKMKDWYNNLEYILGDKFEADSRRSMVDRLLGRRSWTDYARYMLFYKDRFYNDMTYNDLPSFEDMLDRSLMSDNESGDYTVYRRDDGYSLYMKDKDGNEYDISFDDLDMECVIDERFSYRFRNFDKIYKVYCASMRMYNIDKQITYRKKLDEQKFLKLLGLTCKKRI